MRSKALIAGLAAALMLSGCAGQGMNGMGAKQQGGMAIGAAGGALAGGLLGSQMGGRGNGRLVATGVGTAIGLLGGALIGNAIGESLDNADRAALQQNTMVALHPNTPLRQPIQWRNPQSGNQIRVVPVNEGYTPAGEYCREYQQTIIVGGRVQEGHGRACMQPDGSWRVAN